MMVQIVCLVYGLLFLARHSMAQGHLIQVHAVLKGTAQLPCNIEPPTKNDSVILVIWFKNEMMPIYSYDVRRKQQDVASHWKDNEVLGQRGYFRTVTTPATLSLSDVTERDEGVYRCRVDFRQSPSRNTRVNLFIVVPPQKPVIFDERGKELGASAGPYEEGSEMKLKCIVSGGKPPPTVRWWRGERLLDSRDLASAFASVRQRQLFVPRLSRSDLHSVFTCQAANSNLSQPLSASVSLDMYFRPLSTSILSSEQPLSAGRQYEVVCRAVGSRPPAKITWWMDNTRLHSSIDSISSDENETMSTLSLTPAVSDEGKVLTCRAENPKVRAAVEEDSIRLSVFFVPTTVLQLGSSLNADDIEEGDDVYFECKVRANPAAYKVTWKYNGKALVQNHAGGIIMSKQALALQAVNKRQAGLYTCTASNVEGDGESKPLQLKIMYKPLCKAGQQRVYAVARHEAAHVLCETDAFPAPDSFRWAFNNSAESVDVPQSWYNSSLSASVLRYTPVVDLDYGSLLCWAANAAGRQHAPCVFHVIPAGQPEAPFNCSVQNQTSHSLQLHCVEGFDGGQQQVFHLELLDAPTGRMLLNLSSRIPVFVIDGMASGQQLQLLVYSVNSKGRSEIVQLEGFTLKSAEKHTGMPVKFELTAALGALVGIVAVLLLLAIVAVVGAVRMRRSQPRPLVRPTDLALKKTNAVPQKADDKDDRNPDIIPSYDSSETDPSSMRGTPAIPVSDVPPRSREEDSSAVGEPFKVFHCGWDTYVPHPAIYGVSRGYAPSEEVTYAELSLSPLEAGPTLPRWCRHEPVVYAQIDHATHAPRPRPVSPQHREVVTVRTPLMGGQQESCV